MAFWHWLIVAAVFGVVEIASPAMVCLWLSAAALGVAVLAWIAPALSWEVQGFVFAVLAVASVALGRWLFARTRGSDAAPSLNRRGESYVGQVFTLDQPVIDGRGRMRVGDTVWLVRGPDLPIGTRVRVVAAESAMLRIEAI